MRAILLSLPFGLPLYAYGTMLCLSVVIGRILAVRIAERDGLDPKLMDRACVWALAGALVGTRLLFVATSPDQIDGILDVFRFWNGGLVAYGGFLGGFASTFVFCRLNKVNLWAWADCAAPSLCVGLMLTRIGCFLAGCDFGRPWDGPWAISFPAGSPAFQQQSFLGILPAGSLHSLPVHPTQLYESLTGLALLILVTAVRRRRSYAGQAFVALVPAYAVLRYVIEIYRADLHRGFVGPFSTSQVIAVATFISAALLALMLRRGPQFQHSNSELTA